MMSRTAYPINIKSAVKKRRCEAQDDQRKNDAMPECLYISASDTGLSRTHRSAGERYDGYMKPSITLLTAQQYRTLHVESISAKLIPHDTIAYDLRIRWLA